MTVTIPDRVTKLMEASTEQEVVEQLALWLYSRNRISMGKASELAGVSRWEFGDLMHKYGVYHNYSIEDLEQDVATLEGLKQRGLV
jgi:predicted HTH domain antitoxin